jgi:hypothetical protein
MTHTGRTTTVALVAAMAVMMAGGANAQGEPAAVPGLRDATIVLHIVNYAALSGDILDVAKARVAMVYQRIRVRIVWVDSEKPVVHLQDGRVHLNILLLPRDMAERKISAERLKDGVLGQAHQSGGRAHIFCHRIAEAPGALQHFPISLGDIIAHEVGHLVLGANSHSRTGIMRPHVDVRALPLQSFEKTQAETIRTALMALAVVATGR